MSTLETYGLDGDYADKEQTQKYETFTLGFKITGNVEQDEKFRKILSIQYQRWLDGAKYGVGEIFIRPGSFKRETGDGVESISFQAAYKRNMWLKDCSCMDKE